MSHDDLMPPSRTDKIILAALIVVDLLLIAAIYFSFDTLFSLWSGL